MELLRTERNRGVLIVKFVDSELLGDDLIFRVGRDLLKQLDQAAAYGGKLVLSFQGVRSMSSAMIGNLIVLHKRCGDMGVELRLCEIPPHFRAMFPGFDPGA
jgi:anti-anti-sigma regulatory factor